MGRSRGGTGVPDPLKNHKNIGFPSNIDLDPLKITLTRQQNAIQRCFTDGPMVVNFQWHFGPLSLPPLTKCSGSAHAYSACEPARLKLNCRRTKFHDILVLTTCNKRLRRACARVHSQFSIYGYGMSSMQMD